MLDCRLTMTNDKLNFLNIFIFRELFFSFLADLVDPDTLQKLASNRSDETEYHNVPTQRLGMNPGDKTVTSDLQHHALSEHDVLTLGSGGMGQTQTCVWCCRYE